MNQQTNRGKLSGLAITALVFSCLFFLPVIPLVGAIMGIIGTATIKPPTRGRVLAITAIPIGFVMVFFIQGILAAVAIPAFVNYMKRAKTSEAAENTYVISESALSFASSTASGKLPIGTTDWTPNKPCCQMPDDKCSPMTDKAQWNVSPWTELGWRPLAPHHYQYRYVSNGETFEVEARGDLDCDRVFSSFSRSGDKTEVGPLMRDQELE